MGEVHEGFYALAENGSSDAENFIVALLEGQTLTHAKGKSAIRKAHKGNGHKKVGGGNIRVKPGKKK